MTESITVERCSDQTAWDAFVERNGGPPSTRWGWGNAVETYGHDRRYLAARADGDIVGVLPLFRIRSWLFDDALVSVPFTSRGSLIVDDGYADRAAAPLLERMQVLAEDLGVDYASVRDCDFEGPSTLEKRRRWVAFEIPLHEGIDSVWDGLDSSRRGHVRSALDNDLDVRVGRTRDDLREFYRLYLRHQQGLGSPPHSFEFIERLWNELHDAGRMRLFLCFAGDTLTNATICFADGGWVHQWSSISDFEYRYLDGGSLLVWKGLEWGAEQGYDWFGLGRTRKESGVYMFKKSFGGTEAWLDDYHYSPNGRVELPDPGSDSYERGKQLWRRLPVPVTRIVGPRLRKVVPL